MSELYDSDILLWSQHQAELLRRHAAAARVNDVIDWPNIIEEIESVGSEQLHSVESLLLQALIHMLKAASWPLSDAVPHWDAKARTLRSQAVNRFAPSMRQRINMPRIYRQALRGMPAAIDGVPPLPVQIEMPTLDELLSED